MNKRIFLQSGFLDGVEVIELEEHGGHVELRAAILERIGNRTEEVFIFIEDDDAQDALHDLKELVDGLGVHAHVHKEISVLVRYAGRQVHRVFRPSATVGRVKAWALHEFGISESDGAEFMLQVSGTELRPDVDVHIGALSRHHHEVSFDLVPSPRINGWN
jgi:hypothetical protein